MRRTTCPTPDDDSNMTLFPANGPRLSGAAALSSIPSEVLGLGNEPSHARKQEIGVACGHAKRLDEECRTCNN